MNGFEGLVFAEGGAWQNDGDSERCRGWIWADAHPTQLHHTFIPSVLFLVLPLHYTYTGTDLKSQDPYSSHSPGYIISRINLRFVFSSIIPATSVSELYPDACHDMLKCTAYLFT